MQTLMHYLEAIASVLLELWPGALGSLVAVIYEWDPGLTWRQRVAQWIAGICVSYYLGILLAHVFGWDGFGAESAKFMVGMVAFKSAPKFIAKASDVIGDLPQDLRDRFLPRKDKP